MSVIEAQEKLSDLTRHRDAYVRNIKICTSEEPEHVLFWEKELSDIDKKIADNKTCIKCGFHNVPVARVASLCDDCLKAIRARDVI